MSVKKRAVKSRSEQNSEQACKAKQKRLEKHADNAGEAACKAKEDDKEAKPPEFLLTADEARIFGASGSEKWNRMLGALLKNCVWGSDTKTENVQHQQRAILEAVLEMRPQNVEDAIACCLYVAVSKVSLEAMMVVAHSRQSGEIRKEFLKLALNAARTAADLIDRRPGKNGSGRGQQNITVRYMTVNNRPNDSISEDKEAPHALTYEHRTGSMPLTECDQ